MQTAWKGYTMEVGEIITMWHAAVNTRDRETIAEIVADDVKLGGPKGTSSGLDSVIEWVERSGIALTDVTWHRVSPELMIVEESAMWPESETPLAVFTRYRIGGGKLLEISRFGHLEDAIAGTHK